MLEIRELTCAFDDTPVLRGINLSVEQGEIFCLLGPSGCGKTTLLRAVAGLEQADSGEIRLNGEDITRTPVHLRDFGLMFQDFALFPHMDVAKNILFGLKMRRLPREKRENRLREVLALVGLSGFEDRDVTQLSGGEKQRVALARSLAPNPRLLMLDEPLGSLDAGLRDRLGIELRAIIKQVGLTAIYVTHDQQEAFAIADRIAVMNAGRIEQIDTPEVLYRRPQTVFSAQFLGLTNIIPVQRDEHGLAQTPIGSFPFQTGVEAILIHPDDLYLTENNSAPTELDNFLTGTVKESVFQGGVYRLRIAVAPEMMLMVKTAAHAGAPSIGEDVTLGFHSGAAIPLMG